MSKQAKRREFLIALASAGLGAMFESPLLGYQEHAHAARKHEFNSQKQSSPHQLNALLLEPFVDALPVPHRIHAESVNLSHNHADLSISMREIHQQVHRDLPPTRMWSYGPNALGPIIEARSNVPLHVEWINALPTQHFLPIDFTLHGCGKDLPRVRNCVHVHGARVLKKDDGYPDDWYVPGKSRRSVYPLKQDAACLWYHDHAMGLNRLNLYAGLFSLLVVRDSTEERLGLPGGDYELPLVLYDRLLTKDGQLLYPDSGIPGHPWVSDFQGDALLVNGKVRPYYEVEPRHYRLRLLNASNGRFYALSFAKGENFLQIGSDQGLLRQPVPLTKLVLAPGERADLLFDFSRFQGTMVHLRTGAFDFLEFRVGSEVKSKGAAFSLPQTLRQIPETRESDAVRTRTLTLNEYSGENGEVMMLINRTPWHHEVTEKPHLESTEIWEFVNQTEDTHPMHLHLVRFRILDRQPFDTFQLLMDKKLAFTGPRELPASNESGWKDVVQCGPGLVTRILVKFEGYVGKYLYHCHIMEHEANDMMRPFEVIGSPTQEKGDLSTVRSF